MRTHPQCCMSSFHTRLLWKCDPTGMFVMVVVEVEVEMEMDEISTRECMCSRRSEMKAVRQAGSQAAGRQTGDCLSVVH